MSSRPKPIGTSTLAERRQALEFLQLFQERMGKGDASLEMLIYQASPKLGMLVKRQDLFQWFKGRNEISVSKYPSIKAFIETEAFLKVVPEARRFVEGSLSEAIQYGCMLARLHGFRTEETPLFEQISGLWEGVNMQPGKAGLPGTKLFCFEAIEGYGFAILHCRYKQRPFRFSSGFVFLARRALPSFENLQYLIWDRRTRAEKRGNLAVNDGDPDSLISIEPETVWQLQGPVNRKEWPEIDANVFDVLGNRGAYGPA